MNAAPHTTIHERKPLPTRRPKFRRVRLYSALWRAALGDSILGYIIAHQPVELPDGTEAHAIMLQLAGPANVVIFDEGLEDREEVMQPVDRMTAESFAVVACALDRASLSRLVIYADQPRVAQLVEITRVDRPGAKRYHCTISETPAKREDVDPVEMERIAQERAAAKPRG